jgi:(2Fe-2S) ferredoxin
MKTTLSSPSTCDGTMTLPDVFTAVTLEDGEQATTRVVEGQIWVCQGCCCGNTEGGFPGVPLDRFKKEWKERGIRSRIHLTVSGCLGPCAVANVVLLSYRGSTLWFQSINSDSDVVEIYEYVESLLEQGRFELPDGDLRKKVFQRYLTDASLEL